MPQEADIDQRWWSGLPSTREKPSFLDGGRPDLARGGPKGALLTFHSTQTFTVATSGQFATRSRAGYRIR